MGSKASAAVTLSCYRDTQSITRYYKLDTSAPAKPTANPPSGWSTAEPTYTSGSTKTLYFCDLIVFSDGTHTYSAVNKSSSYQAAKEAYTAAQNAQDTANSAKDFTDKAKNNYGYQYKYDITINGDSSTYYPVVLRGGNQNVMREIMVMRGYNEKCPTDWNGHPTLHGISLLLKIKCNYGGWGGANYSWNIHDLEECYGNVFASAGRCMANMGFYIFLRGGGTTGALYHIYSDQALEVNFMGGISPTVYYNSDRIGWSGGTSDSPTYSWNAPAPRTLTDAIKKEIEGKKFIDVDGAEAKIKVERDRITATVKRVDDNETAISTLEQTADGLTVRLDTTDKNVTKAQSTADTAKTNAATAQSTADTAKTNAANAQSTANTAKTNAATAQSTADTAKTNAATAQSTADSVKTNLANNYTKKTLPDTRNDNQPPSWYFTNYPRQIITEFKACSKIGLSGVGTYCTLQTTVPWNDSSGGYPKQTAKVESTGKEFWRVGKSASTWSNWIDAYGTATDAAKTATNYLNFSNSGLVVGNMTASTLGKNVLIDSDSVDIRSGTTTLASFGANQVILGQNAANSEIELCDGAGVIKALTSGASTSYPQYDSIAIESQEIEMNCQRFVATITNVGGSTTPTYQNTAQIYTLSYKSSEGAYARMEGICKITSSGDRYQTGVSAMGLDKSTNTKTMLYTEFWDESANRWAASNQVNVYTNKTTASKPIVINGTWFTGKNKTLWSGGYYMSDTHTATLSEAVSAQANGIVLIWSYYKNGAVDNTAFNTFFIPKQFVSLHNGKGISMFLTTGSLGSAATKYVYVSDTTIKGNANNDDAATAKGLGITSTPKNFVLRYVIGV